MWDNFQIFINNNRVKDQICTREKVWCSGHAILKVLLDPISPSKYYFRKKFYSQSIIFIVAILFIRLFDRKHRQLNLRKAFVSFV